MPRTTCPLCGSIVRAPDLRPHTRLLCKKCHSPFHLSRSGVPVLGAPPDVEKDVEELKQIVREKIRNLPVARVVGALAFLLIVGVVLSYVFRATDSLSPTAESAAKAFAANDLATLKSMAASGTTDDLTRWYEETHPLLVQLRERWNGQTEVVDIGIAAENTTTRQGATAFSVHTGLGNARDVSIVTSGNFAAGADPSFDSTMEWTLSRGHWLIDGRGTYAKLHPPGSQSSESARVSEPTTRK